MDIGILPQIFAPSPARDPAIATAPACDNKSRRYALNHTPWSDDQMAAVPCVFSLELVSTHPRDIVMDLISSFSNGFAGLARFVLSVISMLQDTAQSISL